MCIYVHMYAKQNQLKGAAANQSRINTITELHLIWLVRTRTDTKLWPSRFEYYHNEYIKTTNKNKN